MHMPLIVYGDAGYPILMLPTDEADFLEYERFQLIEAIRPYIDSGRVRVYCVNSMNHRGLLNQQAPPQVKIEYVARYDSYLFHEVLPFIRNDCADLGVVPFIAGISLGAYLASNTFFKHPDSFGGAILMSGHYDIRHYLDGYYSDEVYFNNPVDFLPNLHDEYYFPILHGGKRQIVLFSGQGAYEVPAHSDQLSEILCAKGIAHQLELWGHEVNHDWVWWRKAMSYYFGKLF